MLGEEEIRCTRLLSKLMEKARLLLTVPQRMRDVRVVVRCTMT